MSDENGLTTTRQERDALRRRLHDGITWEEFAAEQALFAEILREQHGDFKWDPRQTSDWDTYEEGRLVPIPNWLRKLSNAHSILWIPHLITYRKWYEYWLDFTNWLEKTNLLPERDLMRTRLNKSEIVGWLKLQGDRKFHMDEEHPLEELVAAKLGLQPGDIFMDLQRPSYVRDTGQEIFFTGNAINWFEDIMIENDFDVVEASYIVSLLDASLVREGHPVDLVAEPVQQQQVPAYVEELLVCSGCGQYEDDCECCPHCDEPYCYESCLDEDDDDDDYWAGGSP